MKNLFIISHINNCIIKKARKQYKISIFSQDIFKLYLLIYQKNIQSVINNLLNNKSIDVTTF